MRSGSKEDSYLRLVDFCFTQLYAESNKEEEEEARRESARRVCLPTKHTLLSKTMFNDLISNQWVLKSF